MNDVAVDCADEAVVNRFPLLLTLTIVLILLFTELPLQN